MDNDNSKRKEKVKEIMDWGYKVASIVKIITWFF